VRRFCEAVSHDGDLAALDELCGPEFHHLNDDLARLKDSMVQVRAGFPNLRFAVEDLIAEGDRVWLRWTLHGTHLGEFLGTPPTGKAIYLDDLFDIFRVANGKLVEVTPHWGCQYVKLFEQIGAALPE
jgi:predicted ester cyclase